MKHDHLNGEELLQVSYGIADGDAWRECPACVAAVERMSAIRRDDSFGDTLPEWFWTRQRQAIADGLSAPSGPRLRWSLAGLAVTVVAAMIAIVPVPAPAGHPAPKAVTGISPEDERLFEQVSDNVTRVAPRALSPLNPILGGQ